MNPAKYYTEHTEQAPIQMDKQAVLQPVFGRACSASLHRFKARRVCSSTPQRFWFDFVTRLQAAKSAEICTVKTEYSITQMV